VKQDISLLYPVGEDRIFAPFFKPAPAETAEYLSSWVLDNMASTSLPAVQIQTADEKEDSDEKQDGKPKEKKKKKKKATPKREEKDKKKKGSKTGEKKKKTKKDSAGGTKSRADTVPK
jgi:uncharacterized protein (DUF2147 family)